MFDIYTHLANWSAGIFIHEFINYCFCLVTHNRQTSHSCWVCGLLFNVCFWVWERDALVCCFPASSVSAVRSGAPSTTVSKVFLPSNLLSSWSVVLMEDENKIPHRRAIASGIGTVVRNWRRNAANGVANFHHHHHRHRFDVGEFFFFLVGLSGEQISRPAWRQVVQVVLGNVSATVTVVSSVRFACRIGEMGHCGLYQASRDTLPLSPTVISVKWGSRKRCVTKECV